MIIEAHLTRKLSNFAAPAWSVHAFEFRWRAETSPGEWQAWSFTSTGSLVCKVTAPRGEPAFDLVWAEGLGVGETIHGR